jgi:hypothetical protein
MSTAAETAMPTSTKTTTHPTPKPAVYSARDTAAMHASAEAGLATEGVLGYHTAMIKAVERAGAVVWRHARRNESTIGAMIESSGSVALVVTAKTILMTLKIPVVTKPVMAVYKGRAP